MLCCFPWAVVIGYYLADLGLDKDGNLVPSVIDFVVILVAVGVDGD